MIASNAPLVAPCLNHGRPDSPCRLDLKRLHARNRDLTARAKTLRIEMERFAEVANARLPQDWSTWRTMKRELEAVVAELRCIYATRAHHRGRVHEIAAKRYQDCALTGPPGTPPRNLGLAANASRPETRARVQHYAEFVRAMLSYQRSEVEDTWDRFCANDQDTILELAKDAPPADLLYTRAEGRGIEKGRACALARALVDKGLLEWVEAPCSFFRLPAAKVAP